MNTITKPTYIPLITEAITTTEQQPLLPSEGFRGFLVEASGKTIVNGMYLTKYLVTLMLGGYLKYPYQAGKTGHGCCHKSAVHAHLASPVIVNRITDAPVTMMCRQDVETDTYALLPWIAFTAKKSRSGGKLSGLSEMNFCIATES